MWAFLLVSQLTSSDRLNYHCTHRPDYAPYPPNEAERDPEWLPPEYILEGKTVEWFTAELLLFLLRPYSVLEPLFHRKVRVSPEGNERDQRCNSSPPQGESGYSDQKIENHHKEPSILSQVRGRFTDQKTKSDQKNVSGPPQEESGLPHQKIGCDQKDASNPPQDVQRGRGYVGVYVEVALSKGEREKALEVVLEVCLEYGWNDVYVACEDEEERIVIREGLERTGVSVAVSEKQHGVREGSSERKKQCEVD